MTAIEQSNVLLSILTVLERIEEKLEKQDKRFEHLENLAITAKDAVLDSDENYGYVSKYLDLYDRGLNRPPSKESLASYRYVSLGRSGVPDVPVKVRYSDWSINNRIWDHDEEFMQMLQQYLGDYWRVPKDNRLPLKFFKSTITSTDDYWGSQVAMYHATKPNVENRLEHLRRFDRELRVHRGNDFLIVDYDRTNSTRIYRIGEAAIGNELMVDPGHLASAPWSRLILYQGMTSGYSIKSRKEDFHESLPEPIPYFGRGDASTGLWTHLFSHLRLQRRNTITNPYLNNQLGFHTTFYEIRERKHLQISESWKQGPLYDHPLGWHFRKSAYTLYAANNAGIESEGSDMGSLRRHWTLLLLAPDYFFEENNTSFPMKALPPGTAQSLGHCLGRLTQQGAEMNLISQGLERISERWAAFQPFFESILDGGDSLMQPAEHDNLLFDDGAFSRSRRYFWAIDCLSEFEASISDNIHQWELYKEARILPLISSKLLPELDLIQLRNVEKRYHVLQNQREYFRQKLESTKALRDALFNASAVIESRASTRLGENVKLLTFVSIFFLPLSFCASLWSINDKFSSTALIVVILIVAFATYMTMFNINRLVDTVGHIYDHKKRKVVQAMKSDRDNTWKQRGLRFDVFRPKHENPMPSEWYITLYAVFNPAAMLGLSRAKEKEDLDTDNAEKVNGFRRFLTSVNLFRRKAKPTEVEVENDQPWVIGE
ncbi:hypothetical protein MMC07_008865 [Pseudocyphellaria aurata]|nr:hypothetical protein [Pseudocyphellaria aurata]